MMRFFKVLTCFIALFSLSCESINEYTEEEIIEGNLVLATIKKVAFGDGDKAIINAGDNYTYYYDVKDETEAYEFVRDITNSTYRTEKPNFSLPAGMGEIKIQSGIDYGCYYIVDFDVVSLPQRRYIVANEEYIESRMSQAPADR